jgi:NADPH:quinone reductase-like Zn-dependent oxidoreductase
VIVTQDYTFADAVHRATAGHGADLIIDGLGERGAAQNLAALAMLGHWVSIGQASGELSPLSPHDLIAKSATFSRPVLFHYTAGPRRLAEMAQRLWSMIESGRVRPTIGARYPLAAAGDAHRALEARATRGSQVLLP